jgi:hypothetical protein
MDPRSFPLLPRRGNRLVATFFCALLGAGIAGAIVPDRLHAQDRVDRFRVGVTVAGTSLVALAVEHQWGDRALEVTVGTLSFRDISLSVVGKQYFSGGTLRPFVGAGLWSMVAFQEQGTGAALIFRAPLGAAWEMTGNHFLGGEINLNRALSVRRTDPQDERPPNTRIVPIPGLFYRYALD